MSATSTLKLRILEESSDLFLTTMTPFCRAADADCWMLRGRSVAGPSNAQKSATISSTTGSGTLLPREGAENNDMRSQRV